MLVRLQILLLQKVMFPLFSFISFSSVFVSLYSYTNGNLKRFTILEFFLKKITKKRLNSHYTIQPLCVRLVNCPQFASHTQLQASEPIQG